MEYLFLDWNGSAICDEDEEPIFKQIGMDEFTHELKYCVRQPRKLSRIASLSMLWKMKRAVNKYRRNPEAEENLLLQIYNIFSQNVVSGIPLKRIQESIDRYAENAVGRLDDAFYEFYEAVHGKALILTAALDIGVTSVIKKACPNTEKLIGVNGSELVEDPPGIASRICVKNYSDKAENLKGIIDREFVISGPFKSIYMGNDFRDEGCAEFVDTFVVAPLATDDFRQRITSKYGNRVRTPSSRQEVYKALTMD